MKKILSILLASCSTTPLLPLDYPHRYRAAYGISEPRFETPWLTTFDFSIAGGTTHHGRNADGQKVPLFDFVGVQAMQPLGINVPNMNPSSSLDEILINLAALPERAGFAEMSIGGKFSMIETFIIAQQNLVNGFFLEAYIPLSSLRVSDLLATDLSPDDAITPNQNTAVWQDFLNNFTAIMQRYGINIGSQRLSNNRLLQLSGNCSTGCGDLFILGGWTHNYQNTTHIDFIDLTGKVGIIVPTANATNLYYPFSLPLGYQGHIGVPLIIDASLGLFNWLTIGAHMDGLFFLDKNQTVRIQTAQAQNGFIKLVRTKTEVDEGTIWDVGCFIKADHWLRGLSCTMGYRYTQQDGSCLIPQSSTFNSVIATYDSTYRSWQMHTLNLCAEYDCARVSTDIGPRIALIANLAVGGKRIIPTPMFGSYIGVDIQWNY